MNASQAALRRAATSCSPARHQLLRRWARNSSSGAPQAPRRRGGKLVGFGLIFGAAAATSYYYPQIRALFSETEINEIVPKAEVEFEKPRKQAVSKEEHRELISSQHLQVQKSWEHPGVYLWGSNVGKVIDPSSNEKNVKLPRRFDFFNDQVLRDLKLTQNFGAAVTEKGDLVQWGLGFSKSDPLPKTTIKGKDIVKIDVSLDRIIALTRSGTVLSVSSSKHDQDTAPKLEDKSSSWSLWKSIGSDLVSSRNLTPTGLGYGERITDISSGLEHCLLLTSKGRVFSAASSTSEFPSHGQMGIPGLTWESRPKGPYDQPIEITALKGFKVEQIATGDRHSVVLDHLGRVFSFGDNLYGQLGFEVELKTPAIDTPQLVATNKLYKGTGLTPKVSSIVAGGNNTFFTVDADAPAQERDSKNAAPARRLPRTTTDLWSAGQGVYGSLGTGRWTHVSLEPTKVKALSSLFEFDETANKMKPIKLKALSVGASHCAAVMDNVTETSLAQRASANETYWGADVLFWGGNEHFQLGNGKRNNQNAPTYIGPLDGGAGDAERGRKGERHRLCLTPRSTARIGEGGKGRKMTLEQKVECGQFVTGVYSSV
jgi:alpha-tubulin suppressor-like RCC1 family protein